MSKVRRLPASERTRIMLDLVRACYDGTSGMSRKWVACEEVADGTGFSAARFADVLAFGIWPSLGHKLIGYEVKASRADLKKELQDLSKHQAVAQFCDEWWLVVWDDKVLVPGVPAEWGLLSVREKDGEYTLHTDRKATKRTPVPWARNFIASLVRNAFEQSPTAAHLIDVAREAVRRERLAHEHSVRRPLQRALGLSPFENRPESVEELVQLAVERLATVESEQ